MKGSYRSNADLLKRPYKSHAYFLKGSSRPNAVHTENANLKSPDLSKTMTEQRTRSRTGRHPTRKRCDRVSSPEKRDNCVKRRKLEGMSMEQLLTIAKVGGHLNDDVSSLLKSHLIDGILEAGERYQEPMCEVEKQCSTTKWCDCDTSGPVLSDDECVCCHSQLFHKFKLGNKECIVKNKVNILTVIRYIKLYLFKD